MASTPDDEGCCGPDFAGMRYERGPSDKNDAMMKQERDMADAIASRYGNATSPQAGMGDVMSKDSSGPGDKA